MCSTTRDLRLQIYAERPNYFLLLLVGFESLPLPLSGHILRLDLQLSGYFLRLDPNYPVISGPLPPHTHFSVEFKGSISGVLIFPIFPTGPSTAIWYVVTWTICYIIVGKPIYDLLGGEIQKFTL